MTQRVTCSTSPRRPRGPHGAIALLAAVALAAAGGRAQDADRVERLRADQGEILRKAERLSDLMGRLVERFEREGRTEQVKLLKEGMQHLESSNLLGDAAGARQDMETGAWSQALRRQQDVVKDLERLLGILLEHNSLESLNEQIDAAKELAQASRALEERQSQLRDQTEEATRTPMSEAEQQLDEQLRNLTQEQRAEANESRALAGQRLPTLEGALNRIQSLLEQQDQLERNAERQMAGNPDPTRQQQFDLGAFQEELRAQMERLQRAQRFDRVQQDAEALQEAMQNGDAGSQREARERLQSSMGDASRPRDETESIDPLGKGLETQRQELEQAGTRGDAERMAKLAEEILKQAKASADAADAVAKQRGEQLQQSMRDSAEAMAEQSQRDAAERGAAEQGAPQEPQQGQQGSPQSSMQGDPQAGDPKAGDPKADPQGGKPTNPQTGSEPSPGEPKDPDSAPAETDPAAGQTPSASPTAEERAAKALQQAAESLQQAMKAGEQNDSRRSMAGLSEAMRQTDQSRQALREANPDPATQADRMAADADQTAQELRNAEAAEDAEARAADALDKAEDALREGAGALERQDPTLPMDGSKQQEMKAQLEASRESLEQARDEIQQALESASQENQEATQAAAERQQQLEQQAQQAQQAMQQAAQQGDLNQAQQQQAEQAMQQAQQAMQQAQQSLQENRPSQASQQQEQAAQKMEEARQELQQNREMGEEQQQALQDLAEQQDRLEDDILRLQEMMEEHDNRAAQEALDRAQDAAKKAQDAMEEGNRDEALEEQKKAEEALDDAADALEEEVDRYMDLRQEELLFRMKDELESFLERQRPVTRGTAEAGEAVAASGRISRPARKRLNDFGEVERELSGKIEFVRTALQEEGSQVFEFVLRANQEDLDQIADRLAGRRPDPGDYTQMLQRDVESRTEELLAALERAQKSREEEQQRREEERQQQEPEQQGENKFNQQRERLVSIIAELKMLKQLELDSAKRMEEMAILIAARGDAVGETEATLIERLANRHNEISRIFKGIRSQMEEALQQQPEQGGGDKESGR